MVHFCHRNRIHPTVFRPGSPTLPLLLPLLSDFTSTIVNRLAERAAPEGAVLRMLLVSSFAVMPMGVQVSPVKQNRFQTNNGHSNP